MQYVMRYWAHRVCEFVISLNTSASTNWIEMYRKYISNCLESYRSRAAVSRAQNSIWLTDCRFAATVERTHEKTDDSKQKDADGVDLMEIKSSPCTRLWWELYVRDFFSVRVFIFEADENGMKDRMKSVRHRRFTIVIVNGMYAMFCNIKYGICGTFPFCKCYVHCTVRYPRPI